MKFGKNDPRDAKDPATARYTEFKAGFSLALLQVFIARDATSIGLIQDLRHLTNFVINKGNYEPPADNPETDVEEWELDLDSTIDASPVLGPGFERMNVSAALELGYALFPQGVTEQEFIWHALGLALIGVHSALELYFSAVSGGAVKGSMVANLVKWTKQRGRVLDAVLYQSLVELDATRHVLIHNAGRIDKGYIAQVAECKLELDERRPLDPRLTLRLAMAAYEAAEVLYSLERHGNTGDRG